MYARTRLLCTYRSEALCLEHHLALRSGQRRYIYIYNIHLGGTPSGNRLRGIAFGESPSGNRLRGIAFGESPSGKTKTKKVNKKEEIKNKNEKNKNQKNKCQRQRIYIYICISIQKENVYIDMCMEPD